MENIKRKFINHLIISNILQTINWELCKIIKYDLSKRLKVLILFDLIIEWVKEFHIV